MTGKKKEKKRDAIQNEFYCMKDMNKIKLGLNQLHEILGSHSGEYEDN
jgi:hypothetical protein